MERTYIDSSLIASAGYDEANQILEVAFAEEKVTRRYLEIPPEIWQEFKKANSKGKYFLKNIRGRYRKQQP